MSSICQLIYELCVRSLFFCCCLFLLDTQTENAFLLSIMVIKYEDLLHTSLQLGTFLFYLPSFSNDSFFLILCFQSVIPSNLKFSNIVS